VTLDIEKVVEQGFCVGCGACAAASPGSVEITLNQRKLYQAQSTTGFTEEADSVCPFSSASQNEDELGKDLFGQWHENDRHLGYCGACYAGSVVDPAQRMAGSSGGMITWTLLAMFRKGLIDSVIQVGPIASNDALYGFRISRTEQEIIACQKSRYYPVEFSAAFQAIEDRDRQIVFVGLPCHVRAVRNLCRVREDLKGRIKYCVSLVCGHLKSGFFADYLSWNAGVHPRDVQDIDFRHKLPDQPANRYGVRVTSQDGNIGERQVSSIYATSWGLGIFKYKACDFCDDVVGELADISFGDAWLPEFQQDSRGTNLIITRNPELSALLDEAHAEEEIELHPLSKTQAIESQSSGFKHRRQGLANRLRRMAKRKAWHPPKRVQPDVNAGSYFDRRVFELRDKLRDQSFVAFEKALESDDVSIFHKLMQPTMRRYYLMLELRNKGLLKTTSMFLKRIFKTTK